jgi:riboflavin synthase
MFTGIVEELGTVRSFEGGRLSLGCSATAADAAIGDSIAVNGICLTVVRIDDDGLTFDVSDETLRRTSLSGLGSGAPVNLERPLTLTSRLGGHLVQGHVDGVASVDAVRRSGDDAEIAFGLAPELRGYLVEKGSITLDGVSLTIASLRPGGFTVALIPHTLAATTFGTTRPGAVVNVEIDVIAKYVREYLEHEPRPAPDTIASDPPGTRRREQKVEGTR